MLRVVGIFSLPLALIYPNAPQHYALPVAAVLLHTLLHNARTLHNRRGDILRFTSAVGTGCLIMIIYMPMLNLLWCTGMQIIAIVLMAFILPCFLCLVDWAADTKRPLSLYLRSGLVNLASSPAVTRFKEYAGDE